MTLYTDTIKTLVQKFPGVVPHLTGRARWIAFTHIPLMAEDRKGYIWNIRDIIKVFQDNKWIPEGKTYDYFLQQLERLIRSVYAGNMGGDFIDIMANLISGQLNQAFDQAWTDEGTEGDIPDYLTSAAEDMILNQYDFVDQLYKDIVDARVDETPIEPLLARAPLWAQRWTEAYNQGVALITAEAGGNMIWELGQTEDHCPECAALNGIVARASEWDELNVHPQGGPNDLLTCGGWNCDCSLKPTDKRRSPKAYETIMNIVTK